MTQRSTNFFDVLLQTLLYGFAIGIPAFLVGFVGPMIIDPSSGNGPLLGIFITGPLGFIVGCGVGVLRAHFGS